LIFPALEQAYLALRSVKARAKHVVLLSDGRTYPDDYEGLVRKMVDAQITVSSVAVGASADQELLRNIANWGKGHEYLVADPKELPQIFVTEAKNAATAPFDEKAIRPIVKSPAFLNGVDLTRLPALKGFTATVMKDSALEMIATPDGDPLLAFWPVGLGRTAVFTSDVRIAGARTGSGGRATVHSSPRSSAYSSGSGTPALALDVAPGPFAVRPGPWHCRRGRDGRGATICCTRSSGSAPGPARRVSSGSSGCSGPLRSHGDRGRAPDAERTMVARTGLMLVTRAICRIRWRMRFQPPDEDLLKAIAAATAVPGGRRPQRSPTRPATAGRSAPDLAGAAGARTGALWFVDLLLRRIRVFENGISLRVPLHLCHFRFCSRLQKTKAQLVECHLPRAAPDQLSELCWLDSPTGRSAGRCDALFHNAGSALPDRRPGRGLQAPLVAGGAAALFRPVKHGTPARHPVSGEALLRILDPAVRNGCPVPGVRSRCGKRPRNGGAPPVRRARPHGGLPLRQRAGP
jgi:hypothetical protein